jgi:2-oxoglutarate dehydrogenase E2 component (dihydrolipoamide succinyltransferase)
LRKDIAFTSTDSDSTEFTVSYWKKDVGDSVSEGDELLVVESTDDKTALTLPSPFSGVLAEVVADEGATIGPGQLVGRIDVD